MSNTESTENQSNPSFQKKVWITAAIVAFVVTILWLLKATFSVFLLVLSGALIALFFTGVSNMIERKTDWKYGICISISIIGTLLITAGLFWLIGAKVQSQISELIETIPMTLENAKENLNENVLGEKIVEKIESKNAMNKAEGFAGRFFKSTFGVFGDIYVILFIGIFFSISPKTYVKGMVSLVPVKGQDKAREVLDKLGEQLRKWLKGKLFAMFVVFVMTAIGLTILGVPLALVLAILAGLLSFIPNFGPILALLPAVLIAMMQSPQTAALVVGLYVLIQFIESNFITPLVQKKLLDMPPALIIIAQLVMGVLTGAWGLILATPLTVIIIVLVQELYIEKREGDESDDESEGTDSASVSHA